MLDGAFMRGTTPTHIFPLPYPVRMSDLADYTVTYRQKKKNILIKHMADACQLFDIDAESNIVLVLSQADTLMFDPKINLVEVQIRGVTKGSDVMKLGEFRLRLEDGFDTNEFNLE